MQIMPSHVVQMVEWADYNTEEAAGLFIGDSEEIIDVVDLLNVAPEPTKSFAFKDTELLQQYQYAELIDAKVIGTWHSHPNAAPIPSEADKTGIKHPDMLFHVILGRPRTVGQRYEFHKSFWDIRMYNAEWDELYRIEVPAAPFLTLEG